MNRFTSKICYKSFRSVQALKSHEIHKHKAKCLAPQINPVSPLYRFIKRKRKDDEFEQIVEQSVQRNH